jgi:choline dehydrogenase
VQRLEAVGLAYVAGMTYIRAQKAQIDAWERLGNTGWNWDSMFPYYKKVERYDPPTSAQVAAGASYEPQYHGTTGPVHVGYPFSLWNGSFEKTIQKSWQALNQSFNRDVNSGDVSGFDVWPRTCVRDRNLRADAAESYYWPVANRANLKLFRGTVTKVVMALGGKATGVEYRAANGTTLLLGDNMEVILSAGSLRTRSFLVLSGIGNPE